MQGMLGAQQGSWGSLPAQAKPVGSGCRNSDLKFPVIKQTEPVKGEKSSTA